MKVSSVTFDEYLAAYSAANGRRTVIEKDYASWKKFHDSVVEILETCGSVSGDYDPLPDFYHSGDWNDSYEDGFAISNTRILHDTLLSRLQACVATTEPSATVEFCGIKGKVNGLEILVTSDGLYANWSGKTPAECQELLNRLAPRQ